MANPKDNGKILSRNELYAPLAAYEQTHLPPSSYMLNQLSIPKTLQESSLVSHLQKVSYNYHRNQAKASDPKNNGSRPNSIRDVDEKIKQRAVSLIGGGVTSSLDVDHKIAKKHRKRKRKQKTWEDVKDKLDTKSNKVGLDLWQTLDDAAHFLRSLNSSWNQYISSVLRLGKATKEISTIAADFVACKTQLELVGAHVRIACCSQRIHWEGYSGIFIGESKNTWQILTLRSKKDNGTKEKCAEKDSIITFKPTIETLAIPKKGSSLILILPDPSSTPNSTEIDKTSDDELIPITSQRSICIMLDPSRNNDE
jgi:RNase P/RNase MRP subunit p29